MTNSLFSYEKQNSHFFTIETKILILHVFLKDKILGMFRSFSETSTFQK